MKNKLDGRILQFKLVILNKMVKAKSYQKCDMSQDKVGNEWATVIMKMRYFQVLKIVFAKKQRQECAWYIRERTRRSVLCRYRVSLTKKNKKKKK